MTKVWVAKTNKTKTKLYHTRECRYVRHSRMRQVCLEDLPDFVTECSVCAGEWQPNCPPETKLSTKLLRMDPDAI